MRGPGVHPAHSPCHRPGPGGPPPEGAPEARGSCHGGTGHAAAPRHWQGTQLRDPICTPHPARRSLMPPPAPHPRAWCLLCRRCEEGLGPAARGSGVWRVGVGQRRARGNAAVATAFPEEKGKGIGAAAGARATACRGRLAGACGFAGGTPLKLWGLLEPSTKIHNSRRSARAVWPAPPRALGIEGVGARGRSRRCSAVLSSERLN
jgi:hypothetical protein